jgi:hypothetical protein
MVSGTSSAPETIGGARRDAQGLGDFGNRYAGKVAQLNQLGGLRIGNGKLGQGFVKRQKILADFRGGDLIGVELLARQTEESDAKNGGRFCVPRPTMTMFRITSRRRREMQNGPGRSSRSGTP